MNVSERHVDFEILHRMFTIELEFRGGAAIGYPAGTPPLFLRLREATAFKLYRLDIYRDGNHSPLIDITRQFIKFQRRWREHRAFMSGLLRRILLRETTGTSLQSYKHSR